MRKKFRLSEERYGGAGAFFSARLPFYSEDVGIPNAHGDLGFSDHQPVKEVCQRNLKPPQNLTRHFDQGCRARSCWQEPGYLTRQ